MWCRAAAVAATGGDGSGGGDGGGDVMGGDSPGGGLRCRTFHHWPTGRAGRCRRHRWILGGCARSLVGEARHHQVPLQPLGGLVIQQLPWNAPPLPANLPTQSLLKFDQPDGQHRYQFPDPPFDRTHASQLATRRSAARSRCSMRARVREMNAEDRFTLLLRPGKRVEPWGEEAAQRLRCCGGSIESDQDGARDGRPMRPRWLALVLLLLGARARESSGLSPADEYLQRAAATSPSPCHHRVLEAAGI